MSYKKFFSQIEDEILLDIFNRHSLHELVTKGDRIITEYIKESYIHPNVKIAKNCTIEGLVYIGEGVSIQDYAFIRGPVIILNNSLIGKSAFIRNGSIIGSNTIIGHSSEITRSILLNNTSIAHFNCITYSIIGSNVNFGSHACTTSFLLKNNNINSLDIDMYYYIDENNKQKVNSKKFGAVIGDNCRFGAYSMTNPGVSMEPDCIVYPYTSVRKGYYFQDTRLSDRRERELV
ncbi:MULTISPECIES: DapH/DapD/GlmU-related protein [Niallia]|uniref:Mannose-1-phosphate guanyltransferase C-terminal domain-containing protein n=1 Tax=Niallia alba TaxID=2729105 RepID=A0A7Y0KBI1_9BACI|nr:MULTISPECIES: DapH/DapD/GlmU-related protein [Niallia]NMO79418.1 hypothetical protein [Niallia alba]UTI42722.1 hypothetical protein NKG37_02930 [Niallia sp. RD1]